MKQCVLLMMFLLGVHGAPVEVLAPGSCQDAVTAGAAAEALNKINLDRKEGYIFSLDRLSNVNQMKHGETGVVFYLTLDVLETSCHVLSKKNWKDCEIRAPYPMYGQCKAVIYMNRVHRVSRLYKYSCTVRPVPASKIRERCPDCPNQILNDQEEAMKTMKMAMEKFNSNSTLANLFVPLNITKASSQLLFGRFYSVEFTIQETACSKANTADISKCEPMACEFAHKGFCKASHIVTATGEENVNVDCEIYEPEGAEEEKKKHLIGGELDHSHTHTGGSSTGHDHSHDHTKPHSHKHDHEHTHGHHHTHEHGKEHGHTHSHEHEHVHDHHDKAHDHTHGEWEHQHHQYGHKKDETHEHDHEIVLDHEHKHRHLHEHEHHHHHHHQDHEHQTTERRPEGMVNVLPSLDQPMTLPSFPDMPAAGPEKPSTLPLHPDPQIPGQREPTILAFPSTMSPQCPAQSTNENQLLKQIISEDPLFKPAA
ncbi:hypothetical protein DNTS_009210 [Danionella cerebrum]|uniref:Fetuin B n=1 Tax=Danionella cerebrum TaxID=2873325 RepID=A0A553MMT3_9TELE|nr:hypothetical protein DNTS_009210 [Danionella translucida]TRY54498.1 hypothetical protein DNTS_009210 [Danionella translucida]